MTKRMGLAAAILLIASASIVDARKYEFEINVADVLVSNQAENKYVMKFPDMGTLSSLRIDHAYIHLYIKVGDGSEAAPYLVRFMPVSEFSPSDSSYTVMSGKWPVRLRTEKGTTRKLVLDVTSVVRSWLTATSPSVYGELSVTEVPGAQVTSLDSSQLGQGVTAKLIVYTSYRR